MYATELPEVFVVSWVSNLGRAVIGLFERHNDQVSTQEVGLPAEHFNTESWRTLFYSNEIDGWL